MKINWTKFKTPKKNFKIKHHGNNIEKLKSLNISSSTFVARIAVGKESVVGD